MSKENIEVGLNIVTNISNTETALNTLREKIKSMDLGDSLKKSIMDSLDSAGKAVDNLKAKTKGGTILRLADKAEVNKEARTVETEFEKIKNKLGSKGFMSAFLEKDAKTLKTIGSAIDTVTKKTSDTAKALKDQTTERDRAKKALDITLAKEKERLRLAMETAKAAAENSQPKENGKFRKATEEELQEIRRLRDEYQKAEQAYLTFDQTKKAVDKTGNSTIERQTAALNAAEKGVQDLSSQYQTLLQQALEPLREKLGQLGINIDNITSIKQLEEALKTNTVAAEQNANTFRNELNPSIQDEVKSQEQLRGAINEANEGLKEQGNLSKELDQFKNRITYFFGMANATRLFRQAIQSAINTVKDLDAVMTEAAVVTNFSVGDMWSQLPEYTKRANALGVSIHDAYESSTLYYQQGLKTNEVVALSNETLKMARIAGLGAEEATQRMTNALRGFNLELTEGSAARVNDVYSSLAAHAAANTDQISTAMTKVASLAHNANMELETTAAFLTQIIETTQESAETAGTALKTVIARFSEVKKLYTEGQLTGSDEEGEEIIVNKVAGALKTAGINMNEYFTGMKGLDQIFMELAAKWDSLDKVQQRYIATQAAGSRQQSRFIAMMSDYARTQELVNIAEASTGASTEQFNKTLDSLDSKLHKLENAWNSFTMNLANSGGIKFAIDSFTFLMDQINKMHTNINLINSDVNNFLGSFASLGQIITLFKLGSAIVKTVFQDLGTNFVQTMRQAGVQGGQSLVQGATTTIKSSKGKLSSAFASVFSAIKAPRIDFTKIEKDGSVAFTNLSKKGQAAFNSLSSEAQFQIKQLAIECDGDIERMKQAFLKMKQAGFIDDAEYNASIKALDQMGKKSVDIGNLGNSLSSVGGMMSMLGGQIASIGPEFEGFGSILSTTGSIISGVGTTLQLFQTIMNLLGITSKVTGKAVAVSGAEAGAGVMTGGEMAQVGWAPFLPILYAILAVLAIVIGLVALAVYAAGEGDREIARLEERTQAANKAAQEAKESYQQLKDSLSNIKEVQDSLDGLVKGTNEWNEAVQKLNASIMELIDQYPELAQYMTMDQDGVLQLDTESTEVQQVLRQKQAVAAGAQANAYITKKQEIDTKSSMASRKEAIRTSVFSHYEYDSDGNPYRVVSDEENKKAQQAAKALAGDQNTLKSLGLTNNASEADIKAAIGLSDASEELIINFRKLGQELIQADSQTQALYTALEANALTLVELDDANKAFIERAVNGNEEAQAQAALQYNIQQENFETEEEYRNALTSAILDSQKQFTKMFLDGEEMADRAKELQDRWQADTGENMKTKLSTDEQEAYKEWAKQQYKGAKVDAEGRITYKGDDGKDVKVEFSEAVKDFASYYAEQENVVSAENLGNIVSQVKDVKDVKTGSATAVKTLLQGDSTGMTGNDQALLKEINDKELAKMLGLKQSSAEFQKIKEQFDEQMNEMEEIRHNAELTINDGIKDGILSNKELASLSTEQLTRFSTLMVNFKGTTDEAREKLAEFYKTEALGTDQEQINRAKQSAISAGVDEETMDAKATFTEWTNPGLDAVTAAEIAAANAKLNQGLGDLISSYDEWSDLIDESSGELKIASVQDAAAFNKMKKAAETMLNTARPLSKAFYENTKNMKNLQKAAQGDTEAIGELQKAAGLDQLQTFKEELANSWAGSEEGLANAEAAIQDFMDYYNSLEIDPKTASVKVENDDTLIEKFNAMANAANMTAEEIQEAAMSMGFDAKVKYDMVKREVPQYETVEDSWTTRGEDGKISRHTKSYTNPLPPKEVEGWFPVVETVTSRGHGGGGISTSNVSAAGKNSKGGGKTEKTETWDNPYDELTNKETDQANLQRQLNKLQAQYSREVDVGAESWKNIYDINQQEAKNLEDQLDLVRQITKAHEDRIANVGDREYKDSEGNYHKLSEYNIQDYFTYDPITKSAKINDAKLAELDKTEDVERGKAIQEGLDFIIDECNKIQDGEDDIEDITDQLLQKQQDAREKWLAELDDLTNALESIRQKQIDTLQAQSEAIAEAQNNIIEGLRESIDLERQIRDNTQKEQDISDKQARLDYLKRDTTGANALEILALEKEIQDMSQSYQDSLVDQQLSEMERWNKKAVDQRAQQIDILQQQLDYDKEQGIIRQQAEDRLNQTNEKMQALNTAREIAQNEKNIVEWNNDTSTIVSGIWGAASANQESFNTTLSTIASLTTAAIANDITAAGILWSTMGSDFVESAQVSLSTINTTTSEGQAVLNTSLNALSNLTDGAVRKTLPEEFQKHAKELDDTIKLIQGNSSNYKNLGDIAKVLVEGLGLEEGEDSPWISAIYGVFSGQGQSGGKNVLDTISTTIQQGYVKNNPVIDAYKQAGLADSMSALEKQDFWTNLNKTLKETTEGAESIARRTAAVWGVDQDDMHYSYDATTGLFTDTSGKKYKGNYNAETKRWVFSRYSESKPTPVVQYTPPQETTPTGTIGVGSVVTLRANTPGRLDSYGADSGASNSQDIEGTITLTAPGAPYPYHFIGENVYGWVPADSVFVNPYAPNQHYKTGGLADFTGPAWLDGTKSHPELVLNQRDTANFIQLRDILSALLSNGTLSQGSAAGDAYININVDAEIGNDYDVSQLVEKLKQEIIDNSNYRNINSIPFLL